ncbi:MAG: TlpA family protein disulfide reductase [Aquificaceae bacterium]
MFKNLLLFLSLLLLSCSGDTLPKIEVKTLEGKRVYLSDYRGKKVLLYVWSRTCAGHSKDLGRLNQLTEEKRDYTIISYAVAMDVQDVISSYKELKLEPRFITLVDTEVRLNDSFPITFLPSTYIFDEKGRFIRSYPGLYVP